MLKQGVRRASRARPDAQRSTLMRSLLAAMLASVALIVVTACAPPAPTPPTPAAAKPAPTTAPAGPPVTLHVSYSNLIADNLPEWMAFESGTFKQNGLDVTLDNIVSSTGIPALLSGQVQVAHLGGSETLGAAAEGGDLGSISSTGPVYPLVLVAAPAVDCLAQVNGKNIG